MSDVLKEKITVGDLVVISNDIEYAEDVNVYVVSSVVKHEDDSDEYATIEGEDNHIESVNCNNIIKVGHLTEVKTGKDRSGSIINIGDIVKVAENGYPLKVLSIYEAGKITIMRQGGSNELLINQSEVFVIKEGVKIGYTISGCIEVGDRVIVRDAVYSDNIIKDLHLGDVQLTVEYIGVDDDKKPYFIEGKTDSGVPVISSIEKVEKVKQKEEDPENIDADRKNDLTNSNEPIPESNNQENDAKEEGDINPDSKTKHEEHTFGKITKGSGVQVNIRNLKSGDIFTVKDGVAYSFRENKYVHIKDVRLLVKATGEDSLNCKYLIVRDDKGYLYKMKEADEVIIDELRTHYLLNPEDVFLPPHKGIAKEKLEEMADYIFRKRSSHDSEGKKNDFLDDKLRWDLLPMEEIEDIVKVYHAGAKKYGDNNWQNLDNGFERYRAAMMRHMMEYMKGERIDADTGCFHLAQVAWGAIAMLYYDKHNKGLIPMVKDDSCDNA